MDKSKEYIKMCEGAPRELVGISKYIDSDEDCRNLYCTYHKEFLYRDYDTSLICAGWDTVSHQVRGGEKAWKQFQRSDDWCRDKHWIRLPLQDQLQDMVGGYMEDDKNNLLYDFNEWIPMFSHCATLEQLWLGFVMHKMYDKTWDDGEWIQWYIFRRK